MLWKPLDAVADWLVERVTARAQTRLGVLLLLWSLYFWVRVFTTKEPIDIYIMSAGALTLSGLTLVVQAETIEIIEKDQKDNADNS